VRFTLASLHYDLSRYQLLLQAYAICLVFLKHFERIYAPLAAGILSPIKGDARLNPDKQSRLDRLYQRIVDDPNQLVRAVGLKKCSLIFYEARTKCVLAPP